MNPIVGPFADVEDDYRRERISGSFRDHRRSGARKLFHRRVPKADAPAVDWFAA
jgi:hypothetical protein